MPISYPSGIIQEHKNTRSTASLFDVSHMGQIRLQGRNIAHYIESLSPIDLVNLPEGRQAYSFFTNEAGGIIDDFVAMHIASEYRIIVNAANKQTVLSILNQNKPTHCSVELLDTYSMIALQGPSASSALSQLAPKCRSMSFMDAGILYLDNIQCAVARSGYTGEDGFEISVQSSHIEHLARKLLEIEGVHPAGLGARDTLRLEAGLCLHGNDISPEISPVEAGLSWAIPATRRTGGRRAGGFPGAEPILSMLKRGSKQIRIGLMVNDRIPVRAKTLLETKSGIQIGKVTSGGFGPSVGIPIALAYVDTSATEVGSRLDAIVRNKRIEVTVAPLPFVPLRYYRN